MLRPLHLPVMNTHKKILKLAAVILAGAATALMSSAEVEMESITTDQGRLEAILISDIAEITAIDYETRALTLMDEMGKEVTVQAGPDVERLDEVEVGDVVEIDYYLSVAAELRAPTLEEMENPLEIEEEVEEAAPDAAPGGAEITMIKAVCTVEGLDRPTATVTLMGPLGGLNVVRVADIENLTKMRIGDTIMVTFTEAVAISVEKVED